MEIIPIGAGSAFAKTLDNTNFLVRPGEGEPFLVDCGTTATRALTRLGVKLPEIRSVLLSHLHADHIGGLEEVGFSGIFMWGRRSRLYLPRGLSDYLWPSCLSGGMGQRLKTNDGSFIDATLETYFDPRPLDRGNRVTFGSVEVTAFRTPHIPGRPSWGFFLRDRATGGSAMLTCDSQLSKKNLQTYGKDADVIFHDCQLDGAGEGVHTSLAELFKIPLEYRKKTILIHYGDAWGSYIGQTGGMEFARQGETYTF